MSKSQLASTKHLLYLKNNVGYKNNITLPNIIKLLLCSKHLKIWVIRVKYETFREVTVWEISILSVYAYIHMCMIDIYVCIYNTRTQQ